MASSVEIEMSNFGLDAVFLNTDKRFLELENKAVNGLGRVLRRALKNDIKPVTPKDTGALRNSGRVVVSKSLQHIRGTIKFGGKGVNYSVIVHEMPNESTNWTTPGTGSKFLERPLRANSKRYFEELAREVKLK